ncbi:MAG: lyase family protein [Pseudomonadota bacterium]|nr:lyase family protein [Pseudomonadota bacterium]
MSRLRQAARAAVILFAGLAPGAAGAQSGSIEDVFSDARLNAYVLEIEAALARAQAAEGVIPQSAADAITAAARPEAVPAEALAEEYAIVRHRMVAFLNVFSRSLDADAANYLHYGATTVDIYDTAAILQVRRSILLLIEDLRAIELELIDLAETHRDTPMIGRTLGQHALPITFGKKVSGWIGENRRHIERLTDLLDRVERSAIMKGAVGSYVGLGDRARAVERRFGEELGLSEPYADDWHASRDVFAEYAVSLGLLARFYGRVGQEVFLLQMTDIAEVIEQRSSTAVGSSTMPHKNNPSLSEALIHYSRTVPALSDIVADDMINVFERDNTSRPNNAIGELSIEAEDMLSAANRLVGRLHVDAEAMRRNLDRSGGWILSQRFVFALAPHIGRTEAEELIRDLAAEAHESGAGLREAAMGNAVIRGALSEAEIEALLDPETYIGLAGEQVDAVIAAARAARETDPSVD